MQRHRHQEFIRFLNAIEAQRPRSSVDREDDGMGGRIAIKPDHVAQLVDR
jgi:hypothetical protein